MYLHIIQVKRTRVSLNYVNARFSFTFYENKSVDATERLNYVLPVSNRDDYFSIPQFIFSTRDNLTY